MGLAIQANQGDWGGAQLSDIEAVARSAADSFAAFDDGEAIAITLEPTANEDDPPMTLPGTGPARSVIRLNVRGNLWARLAYQFGHEYCHVLADPTTWTDRQSRFAWIEEALCETGSLFALRSMAKEWAVKPPYPSWRKYSVPLAEYEAKHVADPMRSLPLGAKFADWLSDRLPLLEADPHRRDDNTIIAKEFLRVFETDRAAWRAVRRLHSSPQSSGALLVDFMTDWARTCPAEYRRGVQSIAVLVGVGKVPMEAKDIRWPIGRRFPDMDGAGPEVFRAMSQAIRPLRRARNPRRDA